EPVVTAPEPEPAKPVERQLERVTLDAETYFEFDKAQLKPGAVDKLDDLIAALKASESVRQIVVTGHADRIGDAAYNQKLSEERAASVRDYLAQRTNMADRITAMGKGETDPIVQCQLQAFKALVKCLQPNRRVDVDATVMDYE
ncbi:MAG: OmpA family protein, partial [Gammaproteobacteria bacterium]